MPLDCTKPRRRTGYMESPGCPVPPTCRFTRLRGLKCAKPRPGSHHNNPTAGASPHHHALWLRQDFPPPAPGQNPIPLAEAMSLFVMALPSFIMVRSIRWSGRYAGLCPFSAAANYCHTLLRCRRLGLLWHSVHVSAGLPVGGIRGVAAIRQPDPTGNQGVSVAVRPDRNSRRPPARR